MNLIFIIIALAAGYFIYKAISKDKKLKILQSQKEFTPTHYFISTNASSAVGVDTTSKKVCFVNNIDAVTTVTFDDIIECEVLEDNRTIQKKSKTRALGGFMVGELLGGVAGGIVGGLSGQVKNIEKVKSVQLRVIINSIKYPTHSLFFYSGIELKKDHFLYKDAKHAAEHWYGVISSTIKQAEIDNNMAPISIQRQSISSELEKLGSLKEKGVITEEEFQAQKKKLLQ